MSAQSYWIRSSLRIGAGAAGGQAILLLSTPLLARIFGPTVFGEYTLLLAFAAVITPVAALKLDAAMLLPRTDEETRSVAWCAMLATTCTSVAAMCLTAGLGIHRGESLERSLFSGASVATLVLSGTAITIMTQAAVRQRQFNVVASRPLIQNSSAALLQMGVGLWLPHAAILVAGQAAGRFAGVVPLWRSGKALLSRPETLRVHGVFRRYWRFPAVFAPSAFLNSLGANLPILIMGAIATPTIAGLVGMAERIAFSPTSIIATAISHPFAAEVSSMQREGRAGALRLYVQTSARVSLIAVTLGLSIAFVGPPFVEPILGTEWLGVRDLLRILAVPVALNLVFNTVSRVFSIFEAGRMSLLADSSRVILVLSGAVAGVFLGWEAVDVYAAALAGLAMSYLLSWSLGFLVVYHASKNVSEA